MKKPFVVLWSALGLATASVSGYAQDSGTENKDDEIVVYGTRLSQPATETGSSVTVIDSAEIEALGVDYLLDAIASAPGVTINQNGAFGGSASVRIRGASSEQTLVLVDGIVVNDPTSPGGGFNFARLDPANVDRIEVLKGPQSTLWGTDAIGGVVNIITKRPAQGFGGSAFAQTGSFSTVRAGGELNGASDRSDFRISLTSNSTDGISKADESNGNDERDGYDATTFAAVGGINLPADARLQATVMWTDADAEFDSFSFGAQGNVGDGDELSTTEELNANVSLQLPLLDGRLDNLLQLGFTDIERENFSAGTSSFRSVGDRTTFRYQGSLTVNESNRLAFGAEREDSEANGESTSIDGLFALYELQPVDSLTLTAGIRRDDHDIFGGETTSRIALAYNPNDRVTLRSSWGEGFKAPTLFQTTFFCCGATEPNSELQPEVSDAYDLGVTLRSADGRGELGITYFDQDTTNLITFSFAVGGYENIAAARSSGVELQGRYEFSEWFSMVASYATVVAVDQDGRRLVRVPRKSGDLNFRFDSAGPWSGNILMRYNGMEEDPNGAVGTWFRIDLAGRYRVSESVELYARVENLLDRDYQQILGYGTPGVSGNVGAQFRF